MNKPHDDRGRSCSIPKLSVSQLGWRTLGLKSITKDAVTQQEQAVTEKRETIVALFGGFIGYWLYGWILNQYVQQYVGSAIDFVIHIVFAICFAMIVWYVFLGWIRKGRFSRIAEIYLSQGFCGSCGYLLDDLECESDGCVICPECNAAWKSERIKPTESTDAIA